MNKKLFFALFVCALVSVRAEYTEEDDVLVLTDDNIGQAIKEFDHILIEFYAPWCGHCKKLAPNYAAAAAKLKPEGLRLAKVDATENSDSAGKYGVQGYPTLKWFVNGEAKDYTGGRETDDIVNWIRKKTGPAVKALANSEELKSFIDANEVAVVFFGDDNSKQAGIYETLAQDDDEYVYASIKDEAAATEYEVKDTPKLVLFKNFDEKRNDFDGTFDVKTIKKFISTNSVPTIMPFNDKAAQKIFGEGNPGLIVFRTAGSDHAEATEGALNKASETLKGEIMMSLSGVSEGLDQRLAEYIGVGEKDLPTARIVDTRNEGLKKFALEGEVTAESLTQFYNDFKDGKLSPVLKSEDIPESNDEPVKVVVGKTFNEIVMDETKDVLMEFYAPWCGHCKALAPKYDELAAKVAGVKDLVIAKMDSTANEAEGVNIRGFPTIKFYPKNNKSNPIEYDEDREVEGFLAFFRKHGIDVDGAASTDDESKEDL